jgi:hypothetical protein
VVLQHIVEVPSVLVATEAAAPNRLLLHLIERSKIIVVMVGYLVVEVNPEDAIEMDHGRGRCGFPAIGGIGLVFKQTRHSSETGSHLSEKGI